MYYLRIVNNYWPKMKKSVTDLSFNLNELDLEETRVKMLFIQKFAANQSY